MEAAWTLLLFVLAFWLAKGSCWPVGGTNEQLKPGQQEKAADKSPNLSLKRAISLLRSMGSMLEENAKEVQLETSEVEAEASVSHLKLVKQPKGQRTQVAGDEPQSVNGTSGDEPQSVEGVNGTSVDQGLDKGRFNVSLDHGTSELTMNTAESTSEPPMVTLMYR